MNTRVVAAVIEERDRFFLTRRQRGVHLEGMWEFPGGKVNLDETNGDALRREIWEELGADIVVHQLLLETTHAYPDRTITLFFYRCEFAGTPYPRLGQEMRWVERGGLLGIGLPPADAELVKLLTNGC